MVDFEKAKDKVMMGSERRSLILSDEEKRPPPIHEAGHAMVAMLTPGTDPVHKVTIIPRGRALGLTQQLPMDERHTYSRDYLVNNLAVLLGGRAAEEAGAGDLHHRRGQRHRAGHRDGPQDGLRVGHERDHGPAHLWQGRRADIPGPGAIPAPRLLRADRPGH